MVRSLKYFLTLFFVLFFSASSFSQTYYVDDSSSTNPDFSNIHDAISACVNNGENDEIIVRAGNYSESNLFSNNSSGSSESIYLHCEDNDPSKCIINDSAGEGTNASIFYIHNNEKNSTIIQGFTIQGGTAAKGGGINIENSSPTIKDCLIQNNYASWDQCDDAIGGGCGDGWPHDDKYGLIKIFNNAYDLDKTKYAGGGSDGGREGGGGIYISNTSSDNSSDFKPVIQNCIISNNLGEDRGGGINIDRVDAIIDSCIIHGNHVVASDGYNGEDGNGMGQGGGGIFVTGQASPIIKNSRITNNRSNLDGGGVEFYDSDSPLLINTIIDNNHIDGGGGSGVFISGTNGSNLKIINSTIIDNDSHGITCYKNGTEKEVHILNSIIWNNGTGTQIEASSDDSRLPAVSFSCIMNGFTGNGINNISDNPLTAKRGDGYYDTYYERNKIQIGNKVFFKSDYLLKQSSPCIGKASSPDEYFQFFTKIKADLEELPADIEYEAILNASGNGNSKNYDMGADQFRGIFSESVKKPLPVNKGASLEIGENYNGTFKLSSNPKDADTGITWDKDYFRFTIEHNARLKFHTNQNITGKLYTVPDVTSSPSIALKDDDGNPVDIFTKTEGVALAGGIYFIEIKDTNGSLISFDYEFNIEYVEDHSNFIPDINGNNKDNSTKITRVTTDGYMNYIHDNDLFEIYIPETRTKPLVFESSSTLDLKAVLYKINSDNNLYELKSDDNSGSGNNFKLTYPDSGNLDAGHYFLKVESLTKNIGEYSFTSNDEIINSTSETPEYYINSFTKNNLSPQTDSSVSGYLNFEDDKDIIKVHIPSYGKLISVTKDENGNPNSDSFQTRVLNSDGNEIASGDDRGNNVTRGDYYVEVSLKNVNSFIWDSPLKYKLFVTFTRDEDDHADSCSLATPLLKKNPASKFYFQDENENVLGANDEDRFLVYLPYPGYIIINSFNDRDTNANLLDNQNISISAEKTNGENITPLISLVTDNWGNENKPDAFLYLMGTNGLKDQLPKGFYCVTIKNSSSNTFNYQIQFNFDDHGVCESDSSGVPAKAFTGYSSFSGHIEYSRPENAADEDKWTEDADAFVLEIPMDNMKVHVKVTGDSKKMFGLFKGEDCNVSSDIQWTDLDLGKEFTATLNKGKYFIQVAADNVLDFDISYSVEIQILDIEPSSCVEASNFSTSIENSFIKLKNLKNSNEWSQYILGTYGEVDVFPYIPSNNGLLVVESDGTTDVMGELKDSNCNQLAMDDDGAKDRKNFKLEYPVSKDNKYYIFVRHHDLSGIGDYKLKISGPETITDPDTEGDSVDSAVNLGELSPGDASIISENHHINFKNDQDYFKIVLSSPGILKIKSTGNADTLGFLRRSDGAIIGLCDDWNSDNNFMIETPLDAGTYYLIVKSYSGESDSQAYSIKAELTANADKRENSCSDFKGAYYSVSYFNQQFADEKIDYSGDKDAYGILIQEKGTYVIKSSGQLDTYGILYDQSCNQIAMSDNGSSEDGVNFRITAELEPGNYRLVVSAYNRYATGNFSLTMEKIQ